MNIGKPSTTFISLPGFKPHPNDGRNELRIPYLGFLPNKIRNHFVAMVGEFIGTFMFLFFAFSATQVANAGAAGADTGGGGLTQVPNTSVLLFIALAFGFSLAVNAWVFFRISGGLFNPAVTLGMALIGAVPWVRAGLVFISQILGAMSSAAVVSALFPGPLNVATELGGNTSIVRGLFIEMFLTSELVFTIFMLAAEKHKGTFLAPVGIGLALFIAELAGVYFTGGSLNPARSFGPCVVNRDFPGYHWIYWLGPALGALMAVGFYRFVKMLEYETANPGQDFNEQEAEAFVFDEENAATGADVARPTAPTIASTRDAGQVPGFGSLRSGSAGGLEPVMSEGSSRVGTGVNNGNNNNALESSGSDGENRRFEDAGEIEKGAIGRNRARTGSSAHKRDGSWNNNHVPSAERGAKLAHGEV